MKRLFICLICLMFLLMGCSNGKKITLNLSFGQREGIYEGELVDGVPNGEGKFTTKNENGDEWTYEGTFVDGHFEGEGKTTWKDGNINIGTYQNDEIIPISLEESKKIYTAPDELKNHCVEIIGKVIFNPDVKDGVTAVQVYEDIENYDNNTIVYIREDNTGIKQDDYLKISGILVDTYDSANVLASYSSAPVIAAENYEKISYMDAVAPTIKELVINETQEQFGYMITVEKVEFSEKETRLYLSVTNNGSDKFNLYSFNTIVVQDGRQYEYVNNWQANYPEVQTGLLVGNSTSGILTFSPIEDKPFQLIVEGKSENWKEYSKIKPYNFELNK